MNEVDFRNWMTSKGINKKVQSDCISRLKRVEKEINRCDIDEQYRNDKCEYIMSLFLNMGENENMKKYPNSNLPIGKYYMSTYRHAVKQYIQFCDEVAAISND
ncbi:hypothetical protein SDC9_22335 [bioreactor metagenome]|jgi:aminopeptidase-like protein|uniref:Uncharacterized protein n=1 Tax=bioreactor metagenome TaxID=1076179 RepID=A0A644UCC4_9ZZZZ|nr:hypothetical protein [Acidaminococcaceae bacterium]